MLFFGKYAPLAESLGSRDIKLPERHGPINIDANCMIEPRLAFAVAIGCLARDVGRISLGVIRSMVG